LNIKIAKGEFVCLIGDVGAGKSSFLSSIIGDMMYLPDTDFNKIQGSLISDG